MNSEPDFEFIRPDDEAAFERFINERFGPEALAHIKQAQPLDAKNGDYEPAYGDLFKPRAVRINIDASLREALRKYSDEMSAKLFGGMVPPVDTGTLRPSLNYGRMAEMYRQHFEAEANRRQAQEAETYRIRQRVLAMPNGEALLARIDAFAQSNGVEWVDAARIVAFADLNEGIAKAGATIAKALNGMFANAAFEAFAKAAQDIIDGIDQSLINSAPANRHERRANRHKKPLKDGDQEWKRRSSRNHRKH
jgi:hypothetical protein